MVKERKTEADRIVSRNEAAIRLKVSKVWISKLCKRAGLTKAAGAYLILESDIEKLKALRDPVGRPPEKAGI